MYMLVAGSREAVSQARRWATDVAFRTGLDAELASVVELLTGELVADAVLFGDGDIGVHANRLDGQFIVSVTDASNDLPGARAGRVVQRLANQWGADRNYPTGKTVWASISTDE
ncbi:ATP-binding protein [Cellulomonas sp. 179-A 4D5 NHS]|uniref:ATP-binding protein n=1 Tax=Cellulomonas sp. 179-A 4D5 NHS TaxID=3142378 RepID=UPI0039A02947